MMHTEEIQIQTQLGDMLYGKIWEPDSDPIAIICIIHGLDDHINRYQDYASFMAGRHIAVIGLDQQGHGNSPGKRGHIGSQETLMSNVQSLLIEARLRYNDIPLFLFGQSMGGNIVLNYGIDNRSKEVKGIIASSPFLELAFSPPKWKTALGRIIQNVLPSLTLPSEIDPMELSHDPEIGRAYMEDPFRHGRISARLYHLMVQGCERAFKLANTLNIPVLLMHGDEDRLTSHESSISLAKLNPIIEMKLWPGMRHELHNERGKDEVLEFNYQWIKNKLSK